MDKIAVAGALAFIGLGVFGAVQLGPGPAIPVFFLAALWYVLATKRVASRREYAAAPFPPAWREVLESSVWYYQGLSAERKADFEQQVAVFIGEHRFVGVDQQVVTDELRLLAASSAVMLLFNRPDLEYPRIAEILFYPRPFSGETFATRGRGRHLSGLNSEFGAVVFSVPDLREGFQFRGGGYHVGLHEFAHALDRSGQSWNSLPIGMDAELGKLWDRAYEAEKPKLKNGTSVLDSYAETNGAEFFAVAVETYFLNAGGLKETSPALYDVLERYFRASPASGPPPHQAKRRPDRN